MTALADLVARFTHNERPDANILDNPDILAQAMAATNFYCGYGALAAQLAIPITIPAEPVITEPNLIDIFGGIGRELINYPRPLPPATYAAINPPPYPDIDGTTDITVSEWALIRPLFLLYIERENAIQLEASRMMGFDPFGRSSSEVNNDIAQAEAELPHKIFSIPIIVSV